MFENASKLRRRSVRAAVSSILKISVAAALISACAARAASPTDPAASMPQPYSPRQLPGLPDGGHFHFALIKAHGSPVCEAYVKRLNASAFTNYPRCDRPDSDAVAGFTRLSRVPLSSAEIAQLFDEVEGLVRSNDAQYFAKDDASHRARNQPVTTDRAASAIRDQEGRVRNQLEMLAYRYVPEVDVDNDGTPDHVIVWRDTGIACGSTKYRYPGMAPTWMVLLDEQGHLDVDRTRHLFEHPDGSKYVFRDPKSGATQTYELPHEFHGIGNSFGLFQYRGQTYIDTFYGPTGDLQNDRSADPDMTLAVFQISRSARLLRCEIHWQDKIWN